MEQPFHFSACSWWASLWHSCKVQYSRCKASFFVNLLLLTSHAAAASSFLLLQTRGGFHSVGKWREGSSCCEFLFLLLQMHCGCCGGGEHTKLWSNPLLDLDCRPIGNWDNILCSPHVYATRFCYWCFAVRLILHFALSSCSLVQIRPINVHFIRHISSDPAVK